MQNRDIMVHIFDLRADTARNAASQWIIFNASEDWSK
jgi:hypothetical protein